ncbi:hypothetical protein [Caballeronia sp. BR00000012568055]|uniref:hypothetical protein n=1 Tax=Caballeronia sp. BR00000012568055 TaxID=2918761 RepID=UPI0023F8E62F|nr:hypothetical protein [Caballeronia sp. BR00000012568055]
MEFKATLERSMLAQFVHHFPELARMVSDRELSTPLTMQAYTGAQQGASYGTKASPHRFLSNALNVRSLIHGLLSGGTGRHRCRCREFDDVRRPRGYSNRISDLLARRVAEAREGP